MENKKLAILGHPTRGKEVIEILEMLGGKNLKYEGVNVTCIYTIDSTDYPIEQISFYNFSSKYYDNLHDEYTIFTLEKFLEKYPFKVGDKVQHKGSTSCGTIYVIEKMIWKDNQINYIVCNPWCNTHKCTVTAEDLQPYKEEIKEEDGLEIYTNPAIDIFISNESLGLKNGYIANKVEIKDCGIVLKCVKNKPQYPKTFEECCDILPTFCTVFSRHGYKEEQIASFQKLLICRDVYWKIAGEEMGLSEPWEQDYDDRCFIIANNSGNIHTYEYHGRNNIILAFPTEEMRDAFYENFKDLIESCKEFL